MNNIPSDWRKLKTNEFFRVGDLCHPAVEGMTFHDGTRVDWNATHSIKVYNVLQSKTVFYRKRVRPTKVAPDKVVSDKRSSTTTQEKVVMVKFQYPDSKNFQFRQRDVQLISINTDYVVGLEYSPRNEAGSRWKFKKFLRRRIPNGDVVVTYYGKPY